MEIFRKIYLKIISLIVLLIILYSSVFVLSNIYDAEHSKTVYNYEKSKYDLDFNDKDLCEMFSCSAVRDENKISFFDKHTMVYTSNTYSTNFNIYKNYYIDLENFNFSIKIEDRYIYLNLLKDLEKSYFILTLTLPIIIMIFTYIISSTISSEQRDGLIRMAGTEALMTNKSMIMITENIHHELNTPMEVIDNKIEKIRRKIDDINPVMAEELEEDFYFVSTAGEQIRNILNKMKDFKHLRYSNGNQNIYNISKNAFKMVAMSIPNFRFNIDMDTKLYGINSESLKNADLLNVLINHIKNSLEATADKIHIIISKYENGLLYLRILDNGTGIPERMRGKIFNPNFSTKNNANEIRGNGMYLNKQLLTIGGGDIKLIESGIHGTTIELIIPCKLK